MAISEEQAGALAQAYQSGSPDVQSMVNSMGVTQADVAQYFPGFDVSGSGYSLPSSNASSTSAPLGGNAVNDQGQTGGALSTGATAPWQGGLSSIDTSAPVGGNAVSSNGMIGGALSAGANAAWQGGLNSQDTSSAPAPYSSSLAPATANDSNQAFNQTYNAIQLGNTRIGTTDVIDQESGSTSQKTALLDANGNPLPPDSIVPLGQDVYEVKLGYGGGADYIIVKADPKTGVVTPVQDYNKQVGYLVGEKGGALGAIARQLGPIPSILATVTGNAELVPLINAGTAAVEGKNIGDIGKAYVLGSAAQSLAPLAGDLASTATGSNIVGGAVQGLTGSEIATGGKADPLKAFVTGGISSAVPAVASQVDGYNDLTKAQQAMVNNAIAGTLSGLPASQVAINIAVSTAKQAVQDIKNTQAEQDAIDKGLNEKPISSGSKTNTSNGFTVTPVGTSSVTGTALPPLVDNTGITGDQSLANAYTNTGSVVTGEGPQKPITQINAPIPTTAVTKPVSEWDTNAGPKAGISSLDPRSVRYSGYDTNQAVLNASDQANKALINNLGITTDPFTGQAIYNINTGDTLKASDQTNPLNVIKAGFSQAGSDIAGLGVRGAQFLGSVLGFDTSGLNQVQNLLQNSSQVDMNKLVGQEKNVAGAISSTIESVGSAMVGGPMAAVPAMGAIVANNSWVEGAKAGLDNTQNAIRTTLMSSAEMLGEAIGVPGMSKVLNNLPKTATASDIINTEIGRAHV